MHVEMEHRGRILLAEDDLPSQKLVKIILERQFEVIAVNDGVGAVEASAAEEFDLILLDLMMPKMDGFEAARHIRERERRGGKPSVPIVALTAMVTNDTRRKCYESQMDEFIPKPIDLDHLCTVVQKFLH